MSVERYHGLCQRYRGRAVEIKTHDGRVHKGIIHNVDNRNVFLRPLGGTRGLGGFGYGFAGGFGGYGGGYRIALGAIAGIALVSLFFW